MRYKVTKAEGIDGPPIPDDEPCLVIRAQDVLCARMLLIYLESYAALPEHDPQVLAELARHYAAVHEWQAEHPTKLADR